MAGRGRAQHRGGPVGRGRGRAAAQSSAAHLQASRKEGGFAVSLRRAADNAAAIASRGRTNSSASASARAGASAAEEEEDDDDVTLVYRRPARRQPVASRDTAASRAAAPPSGAQNAGERHVHFGTTTVHTFDDEDESSLLFGSGRHGGGGSATASTPLQFWQRAASASHLPQALRECASVIATDATSSTAQAPAGQSLPSLAELDETRLRVAVQALLDVRGLLLFPRAAPGAAHAAALDELAQQSSCWVAQTHAEAVIALVQLSDAAVPSREPSLVSGDALKLATCADLVATWPTHDALPVVPSPVCPCAVELRLHQLVRLCQLRQRHEHLLPVVRQCATLSALSRVLFSHADDDLLMRIQSLAQCESRAGRLTCPVAAIVARAETLLDADTFLLMPGLTSRHRREQAVLSALLKLANGRDCAMDVVSWGPMAMLPPLKVTQGVYVVDQLSRMYALERVLQEAEFYGLPTFLRSIRRPAASASHMHAGSFGWPSLMPVATTTTAGASSSLSSSALEDWLPNVLVPHAAAHPSSTSTTTTAPASWHRPPHQIFLASDVLDGDRFHAPDPMQAPVVQEELIDLCLRHCCYGMVVGEADQIVNLFHQTTAFHTAVSQRRLQRAEEDAAKATVKSEALAGANDDEEADNGGVTLSGEPHAVVAPQGIKTEHARESRNRKHHHHQHDILRDPLGLYARRARAQAREASHQATVSDKTDAGSADGDLRCMALDWLCTNRWSAEPDACYYGLVYGVVVEESTGLYSTQADESSQAEAAPMTGEEAVDPNAPLDVDAAVSDALKPAESVTYYVAAVVELRR